jgi:exopolysaccharide biosynthesis polyprenyl glycosylphosphotransferase
MNSMSTKRSDIVFTLLTVVIDAMMIFLAFWLAYWTRAQVDIIQIVYLWPFDQYIRLIEVMIPFWIGIFASAGLYTMQPSRANWGAFTKVFLAVSSGIMFFVVWVFLTRTDFFSRLIVIYAWLMAIFFVFAGRLLIGAFQRWLYRYGFGVHTVIIIGQTETAQTLKDELEQRKEFGYRVINGLVDPTAASVKKFLDSHHIIDEMIVADSEIDSSEVLELIALAEEHHIAFRLVPNLFEVKSTNVEVETLAAIPLIAYRQTPLGGWMGIVKRIFDIVGSAFALLILSPLFVLISLLVKLDSEGPVYYRHKRLGMNKKHFNLYKFRTMQLKYCTGEDYTGKSAVEIFKEDFKDETLAKEFVKVQKLKDDPRVTNLGRILRKTSLDELPQIFNVFLGHLSLVGPRPIIDEELTRYGQYKHRLFVVKPGMTGLWQISGRSDMPYKERVKLDMYYIENWSLWNDIVILIKTFFVILFRKNAY